MPRNPNKQPCAVPGCRAWAMRGQQVCGPHRSSPSPFKGEGRGEGGCLHSPPPLTADYTLDDLAAHAALALNRLQAWYRTRDDDDPRWVIAYVRQLYQCLARLADLWKQRTTLGEGELAAALNGALAELQGDCTVETPNRE
jgi:hypothetical protein